VKEDRVGWGKGGKRPLVLGTGDYIIFWASVRSTQRNFPLHLHTNMMPRHQIFSWLGAGGGAGSV